MAVRSPSPRDHSVFDVTHHAARRCRHGPTPSKWDYRVLAPRDCRTTLVTSRRPVAGCTSVVPSVRVTVTGPAFGTPGSTRGALRFRVLTTPPPMLVPVCPRRAMGTSYGGHLSRSATPSRGEDPERGIDGDAAGASPPAVNLSPSRRALGPRSRLARPCWGRIPWRLLSEQPASRLAEVRS